MGILDMSWNQKCNINPFFKPRLKPKFFLLNRLPGEDVEGGGDDGEDGGAHRAGHHGRAASAVRVGRLWPEALPLGGGGGSSGVEGVTGLHFNVLW